MTDDLFIIQTTPPDAFLTTWPHIYAVAAFGTIMGMMGGAATMYLRLYLNGDLVGREPHFRRRRRSHLDDSQDCGEADDQADQED